MQCPSCKEVRKTSFNRHAEGFAKDVCECTTCGTVWLEKGNGQQEIISETAA